MFYANLGADDDKVSCYIMHKHLAIDVELLEKEFEMVHFLQSSKQDPFLIIRRS